VIRGDNRERRQDRVHFADNNKDSESGRKPDSKSDERLIMTEGEESSVEAQPIKTPSPTHPTRRTCGYCHQLCVSRNALFEHLRTCESIKWGMSKPKEKEDKAIDAALLTAEKEFAPQPNAPAERVFLSEPDTHHTTGISGGNHDGTNTKQEEVGIFDPGRKEPNDGGVITDGKTLVFTDVHAFCARLKTYFEVEKHKDAKRQLRTIFKSLLGGPALTWWTSHTLKRRRELRNSGFDAMIAVLVKEFKPTSAKPQKNSPERRTCRHCNTVMESRNALFRHIPACAQPPTLKSAMRTGKAQSAEMETDEAGNIVKEPTTQPAVADAAPSAFAKPPTLRSKMGTDCLVHDSQPDGTRSL
jgi:hypothetical protein